MSRQKTEENAHRGCVVSAEIKERPVLFSSAMVRAVLAGRKTQTRRVVKFCKSAWLNPLPVVEYARDGGPIWWSSPPTDEIRQSDYYNYGKPCPFGEPGDRLWVRETFCALEDPGARRLDVKRRVWNEGEQETEYWVVDYKADGPHTRIMDKAGMRKWTPSIHMPHWASRITLEIAGVRVERLQEISEEDAIAEGIHKFAGDLSLYGYDPNGTPGPMVGGSAVEAFALLWESIYRVGSWAANPWVWVIGFRRVLNECKATRVRILSAKSSASLRPVRSL